LVDAYRPVDTTTCSLLVSVFVGTLSMLLTPIVFRVPVPPLFVNKKIDVEVVVKGFQYHRLEKNV